VARWIAQRRSRRLFDICAGFVYAQVLFACVRLRLFAILMEGPQTAETLSRRLSLPGAACRRLLDAAIALDLVEPRSGGRFGLGPLGAVVAGSPGLRAMVEHHAMLYADLADPVGLLRGERDRTALGRFWPYAQGTETVALPEAAVAGYSDLMAASQALIADDVLDAYPVARHRRLLDVGGGDGTFLSSAAARAPDLDLVLFDLPPVAERARSRLAQAGLSGRVRVIGGDFLAEPLPTGADLISLVRVVHDHDDDAARVLLGAARRALADDGTLLLAEPMARTRGAEPIGDAYFGFYLLAMGSGRPRSREALEGLLRDAGFSRVKSVATRRPMLTRALISRP